MTIFRLSINIDNAAFEEEPDTETARILRSVADILEGGRMPDSGIKHYDGNGNNVGHCGFKG